MTGTMTKPESTTPRRWFEQGPMASLRDEMDELFENFLGTPTGSGLSTVRIPSIDISETDDAIQVTTDVPGMKAEDVDIEIRNDHLTISGDTSEETESKQKDGRTYHRIERRSGSFSRTVRLPCDVQQDKVAAELKDGVLTVTLPKAEVAKSKKIPVKG